MKILAIDDKTADLKLLSQEIKKVYPDAEVQAFSEIEKVWKEVENTDFNVFFCCLDTYGFELAEHVRKIYPACNIIIVADTMEYMADAMKIHVSGYIQKPVSKEAIRYELSDLRYPVVDKGERKCRLQCYGNFEVFNSEGNLIHFKRRKSKEALAYITHRRGAVCTMREVAAILFEDAPCDLKQMSYMQKIISGMINDLNNEGAAEAVIRHYNGVAIDTTKVVCDYYNNPDRRTIDGEEYMAQYSWAEYT